MYDVTDPTTLKQALFKAINTFSHEDKRLITGALTMAEEAHVGQVRKNGTPFILHPFRVTLMLLEQGENNADTLSAALLHDTLEDTHLTHEKITEYLSKEVTKKVQHLTKTATEAEYFANLALAPLDVVKIKIFDRIDNLNTITGIPKPEKRTAHIEETEAYLYPIARQMPDLFQLLYERTESAKLVI